MGRGGLTWCWEKRDNCSKEVTISKQKHSWDGGGENGSTPSF